MAPIGSQSHVAALTKGGPFSVELARPPSASGYFGFRPQSSDTHMW